MAVDRSTAAIITAAISVVVYIAFIGVTIYYGRKPGLAGRISVVLVSLVHSLLFRLAYETCVRWEFCSIPTNTFRVWSGVISIHFVVAWVLCLRGLSIYIDDLLDALEAAQSELVKALALTHDDQEAESDE